MNDTDTRSQAEQDIADMEDDARRAFERSTTAPVLTPEQEQTKRAHDFATWTQHRAFEALDAAAAIPRIDPLRYRAWLVEQLAHADAALRAERER